jgi:hypothetical protein
MKALSSWVILALNMLFGGLAPGDVLDHTIVNLEVPEGEENHPELAQIKLFFRQTQDRLCPHTVMQAPSLSG